MMRTWREADGRSSLISSCSISFLLRESIRVIYLIFRRLSNYFFEFIYESRFVNVVKFILRKLYRKILSCLILVTMSRNILSSLTLRKLFHKMLSSLILQKLFCKMLLSLILQKLFLKI